MYLVAARTAEMGVDLNHFYKWFSLEGYPPWVVKEVFFHLMGRVSYTLFDGQISKIYLAFDALWIPLLIAFTFYGARVFPEYRYSVVIYLCSFMVLLGAQNFLRQHVAIIFLIAAYIASARGRLRSSLLIIVLASFFHNSALLGLPAILLKARSGLAPSLWWSIAVMGSLVFVLGLGYFSIEGGGVLAKSNASTGMDLSFAYIALLLCFVFLSLQANEFQITVAAKESVAAIVGLVATVTMAAFYNSAPAERVGLMFLSLSIFDAGPQITRVFKFYASLCRVLVMAFLAFPGLLFFNSRQFLTVF